MKGGEMERDFETLIIDVDDDVCTITMNRPEVLNALSPKMLDELTAALGSVAKDETIKAVIITGAGEAFSSGGDVKSDVSHVSEMTPFEFRSYIHTGITKEIVEMEKPVIVAVNGIAVGGAFDFALACDIRLASEKARFSEIFVRMGILPELGGLYFLPRLVGLGRAKLLAFTGDIIDAQEAERIGLVDEVFPHEDLLPAAKQLAQRLAKGPTKAIAMIKVAMNKSLSLDLNTSLDYSANLNYFLIQTEDHREAFTAFLEKRKPFFKGK